MKKNLKKISQNSAYSIYGAYRDRKLRKFREKKQKMIFSKFFLENKEIKLHLGCGSILLQGWLNTDLNDLGEVAFLDAGSEFPFKANSIDFIYSEHLFEHLTVDQQIIMLSESYRCLKTGGVIRIATPSLDFLMQLYQDNKSEGSNYYSNWAVENIPHLRSVRTGIHDRSDHYCFVINNFFKAWGHQMIHNFNSLRNLGLQVGYSTIKESEVGKSEYLQLKNIERHGTIIPEEINKMETMILEMIK